MEPTTIRLEEELLTAIDNEADRLGFSNRTEYIRFLLRNRPDTESMQESPAGTHTWSNQELHEELETLRSDINELKQQLNNQKSPTRSGSSKKADSENQTGTETNHQRTFSEDPLDELLAQLDLSSGLSRSEVRRALDWLRKRDSPATKSEFQEHVYDGKRVDFTEASWWEYLRDILKQAVDRGVIEYQTNEKNYWWVGKSKKQSLSENGN